MGHENYPDYLKSIQKTTFLDPSLYPKDNVGIKKMDPSFLKSSHWSIGDNQNIDPSHFDTTYGLAMDKKPLSIVSKAPSAFTDSINLNGDGKISYLTENRENFYPYQKANDPNEKKVINDLINTIKKSHFVLGENPNDFKTMNGCMFNYNPEDAKNAKSDLNKNLLQDLTATHYKLGYGDNYGTTTYNASYVPPRATFQAAKDPNLRASHIEFGDEKKMIHQDDKTIYMTDYTRKPLPVDDD